MVILIKDNGNKKCTILVTYKDKVCTGKKCKQKNPMKQLRNETKC